MQRFLAVFACVGLLAGVVVAQQKQYPYPMVRNQRGAVPAGPRVGPWNSPPLGDGPFLFDSYEQRGLRAVVMAKGLSHPWSIAFLPGRRDLDHRAAGRLPVSCVMESSSPSRSPEFLPSRRSAQWLA